MRAQSANKPLNFVHFLDKGELIFMKEIKPDAKITIPYEGEAGEKMMFEMTVSMVDSVRSRL